MNNLDLSSVSLLSEADKPGDKFGGVIALRQYLTALMGSSLHTGRLAEFEWAKNDSPYQSEKPEGDLDIRGLFFLANERNHGNDYVICWGILRSGDWAKVRVDHAQCYRRKLRLTTEVISDADISQIATFSELLEEIVPHLEKVAEARQKSYEEAISALRITNLAKILVDMPA